MTTLAEALGSMARPLARVVAQWSSGPAWRRCVVWAVYPELARALDGFADAVASRTRPL